MASPLDTDNDTSSLPIAPGSTSSNVPESEAYSNLWNELMNSPYERVDLASTWATILLSPSPDTSTHEAPFYHPGPMVNLPAFNPPLDLALFLSGDGQALNHGPPLDIVQPSLIPTALHPSLPGYDLADNTLQLVFPFTSVPQFSESLGPAVLELPLLPAVHVTVQPAEALQDLLPSPPPLPPAQNILWNDYTDGGRVSNALSLPCMVEYIQHIDRPWSFIFIHAWHAVFHDTHVVHPPSRLIRLGNVALSNAYIRWEQQATNEPLLSIPVTINNVAMLAIRHYNAPPQIKPLLLLFNSNFKSVIRMARQACMNHLMRCTLQALVLCGVVPFLPTPHVDIRPSQTTGTIIPRVYTRAQKISMEDSVTWNNRFDCRIWHSFEGNRIIWFGNQSVRLFLTALLSPDELAPCALGVRRARRILPGVVASWEPVTELDNHSVLVLIAKSLSSLSTSIISDAAQKPRQLPIDRSDGNRTSAINRVTKFTCKLLNALDDLTIPYPYLSTQEREEGHLQLILLKEYLGFQTSSTV